MFIFAKMPVGEYAKNILLANATYNKFYKKMHDEDEANLRRPKLYLPSGLAYSPISNVNINDYKDTPSDVPQSNIQQAIDVNDYARGAVGAVGKLALIPQAKGIALDLGKQFGLVNKIPDSVEMVRMGNSAADMGAELVDGANAAEGVTRYYVPALNTTVTEVSEGLRAAGEVGKAIGTGATVVGVVASGGGLGFDIADAVDKKKVTFDNAMKISDDATGLVSAGVSLIPGVGVPIALALQAGEKLVTGIIKGADAVKEEKKREGVKHLKPKVWFNTVWRANTPAWMNEEIHFKKKSKKKR
jgi:hypothetical protein